MAAAPSDAVCPTCGNEIDQATGCCAACLFSFALLHDDGENGESLGQIGQHELLAEIGHGGMGVIYRARHVQSERIVALKILLGTGAGQPELLARFRREVEAVSRLDHPHVLPIYEVNEEPDGAPFFTMKLATGGSLSERGPGLLGKYREIVSIMAKVARAAEHAHAHGVLHRDLKPGNILFDAQGEPLLGDFGLATWLDAESDLTRSIMVCGTPGYLPPEYLVGRPETLTAAGDIYSLGAILFELLAGRLPFEESRSLQGLHASSAKAAPRLSVLIPRMDRDLEIICACCLEVDPTLRYASAGALADDLERWLADQPIRARLTPIGVRAWKFLRRHPAPVAVGLLMLLLLGAAMIINRSREKTVATLAQATAYDRTVTLLPLQDLDAIGYDTPTARAAQAACLAKLGTDLPVRLINRREVIDPVPVGAAFGDLSRKLDSRYVLFGTIRRKGELFRCVVHLLDAQDDETLDIEEFETADPTQAPPLAFANLLSILRRGGKQPLTAWAQPTPPETPEARLAEQYLVAGQQHLARRTEADVIHAIDAFRKAEHLEPQNAGICAALAGAMATEGFYRDRNRWLAEAAPLAERALQLDPRSIEAHATLADILYYRGQNAGHEEHALAAYELEPRQATSARRLAVMEHALGAHDQAVLWIERACAMATLPGDSSAYSRAEFLGEIGLFDESRAAYQQVIEFRSQLSDGPLGLAHLAALQGDFPAALAQVNQLAERFPHDAIVQETRACFEAHFGDPAKAEALFREYGCEDPHVGLIAYMPIRGASAFALAAQLRGDPAAPALAEQALALDERDLRDAPGIGARFEKAADLCLLGHLPEALQNLQQIVDNEDWFLYRLKLDRRLSPLRELPEFQELVRKWESRYQEQRERLASRRGPVRP